MELPKIGYPSRSTTTRRAFYGTGWPVRNPSRRSIVERSQYRRQRYLWISCTQLGRPYTASDQRRIVGDWCEFFGGSSPLRELALRSRVPTPLFDAVCGHVGLRRLHVKWGPVADLSDITKLKELEGLSLGKIAATDVSPVAELPNLSLLQLEGLERVDDYSSLAKATRLEFLQIAAYPTPHSRRVRVKHLEFLAQLTRLRALSLDGVRLDDKALAPLFALKRLEYLDLHPITEETRARLATQLPNLRFGNVARPGV